MLKIHPIWLTDGNSFIWIGFYYGIVGGEKVEEEVVEHSRVPE